MHCKHCGADLDKQQTICPECGVQINEEMTTTVSQQEDDFSGAQPNGDYGDFKQSEDTEDPSVSKKKKNPGLIAAIAVLCVVAVVAAVLFLGRDKSPYTGPMASDQYIVAEYKDHQLTNQIFMYYYWAQFYQLYQNYGNNITLFGLDLNKPFEEQPFGSDGRTWADFFTEYALMQWLQDMAVMDVIKAEGFTLSEAQQTDLKSAIDALETEAAKNGYANGEEYLKNAFDLSADVASYNTYTTITYTAGVYKNQKYYTLYAQGMANPGDYKDIYCINIRHILIKFADSTEASKAAAKAQAEALYNTFKQNPTGDNFIQLAKDNSADSSASAGGLIENVEPGQMVQNFNDWCFTEGRKTGDHGLVETEYGWHLMFFDGYTENIYQRAAEQYANDKHNEWMDEITKGSPLTQFRDKITFRHPKR